MSKVIVIGSGIVGLWTAEVLASRKHSVTVVSDRIETESTSAAAACVITPLLQWEETHPMFFKAWGWYRRTIDKFRTIDAMNSHRFLEPMPSFECGFEEDGENYLEKGFSLKRFDYLPFTEVKTVELSPPVEVNNHIGDVQQTTFCAKFVADFCHTGQFLSWLRTQLVKSGVKFEKKRIEKVDELGSFEADVIFNCTGYYSNAIFDDPEMHSIRGQSMFIDVKDQTPPYFGIASGHHAVFKHRRGFYLGSYFIEHDTEFIDVPQDVEKRLSIDFVNGPYSELCRRLGFKVPLIDLSKIGKINCGHRPFRENGPRIEGEEIQLIDGTRAKVIHHYGHGAHGWTLGYATAQDSVFLAEVKGWLRYSG